MGLSYSAPSEMLKLPFASATRLALCASLFLSSACSGGSAEVASMVRDSAGVTIVESTAPATPGPAGQGTIKVDSAPLWDINGAEDGREELAPNTNITRLPGGAMVVATGRELRWYDGEGRWVRTVGREGNGPAEFRQFDLLKTFGDSVLVYDLALRRVTVFDSAGTLGRVTTIVGTDSAGASFPLDVLNDGRLLLGTYPRPVPGSGVQRDPIILRIATPEGVPVASLGRFPLDEQAVVALPEGGVSMRRVVFMRSSYFARHETKVLVATNERFGFDWYGADGRLMRSVRRSATPVPVTDAEAVAQIDEWLEGFPAGREELKAQRRQEMLDTPRPQTKPLYARVVVASNGEVWVQEYGEPRQASRPSTWSVFDPDGRWQTQVTVPAGVTPLVIGPADLLATWNDAEGVIHVRKYGVQR